MWLYRPWIVQVYNTHQTQTNEKRKPNERTLHTNDTKNARYTKRTHDTRTNERNETNEL